MSNNNIHPRDSHGQILKSSSILSLGTLSSRILGFFRDIILAKLLGTSFQADAFFVALKIPNLFRSFVGEGATNAAVVPVFSEFQAKQTREEFWRFVMVVLVLAFTVLGALTLLGILLAPLIVRIIAPGFLADPQKLQLTVKLTRLMFPYLVLIGLTAYSMAVLYAFRSFKVPAFSPCLFNIAVIAGAWLSPRWLAEPVYGLGISVVAGGLLQLLVYLRPLRRLGMRWRRPETLRHPGAAKIGQLLMPRLLGAGVYQLTVFIDTFCASLAFIVGAGGISAIYYANRIIQFPMGLFSVALASAALPALSGLFAASDMGQFKKTLVFSLKNVFYIIIPTTVLAMLLAAPVIRVLFQRGEFGAYSTMITASALFFYAAGLFSFAGIKILVSAFYALQDTKTPVKVAALCLVINTLLNFVLMFPMGIGGIALASSLAATVDFFILYHLLEKRLGPMDPGLRRFIGRVLLAGAVMAWVVYLSWRMMPIQLEWLKLILAGVEGFLVYGMVTGGLKIEQTQQIWRWILKRK